jgi:hypothetical protein
MWHYGLSELIIIIHFLAFYRYFSPMTFSRQKTTKKMEAPSSSLKSDDESELQKRVLLGDCYEASQLYLGHMGRLRQADQLIEAEVERQKEHIYYRIVFRSFFNLV